MTGKELYYIAEAHFNNMLAGDGPFTKKCHAWLEERTLTKQALLTHSCTAALEMAALLIEIEPGDEVIMPSYTFVSTANACSHRWNILPIPQLLNQHELSADRHSLEYSKVLPKRTLVDYPI